VIPAFVRYTGGLVVEPRRVICRRLKAPTPPKWLRHQFVVEGSYTDPEWPLCGWLENNLVGRWSVNVQSTTDGILVVVAFEEDTDAVMFRLMDGETAWRETVIIS
jgi:hypothetical protein